MSIVFDTLIQYLPAKRKQTPSGWLSFNAPCCQHNGTSADTRSRAGLIQNADQGLSYHCFNCGYKASWVAGRNLTFKLKRLMQWLNVPDDVITKLALHVLQQTDEKSIHHSLSQFPKFKTVELPKRAKTIFDWHKDFEQRGVEPDTNYIKVLEYINGRNLNINDYDFYWTPEMGYRDRMIVPFYYQDKIVGWTARKIVDDKVKYLSEQQPGYVFNLDAQDDDRLFVIAVEGPIDAILLDGVAFLGSEVKQQQSMLIKSLNKKIIVVPDRDSAGEKLIHDAMELEWSVSMPEWDHNVKDINDAVIKYGRLHTLYSIVKHAENQQLKIKLRMKKWLS